ncbi:MAG TPA: YqaJ viral recombinase family protein [Terriglobales bacterium]
MALEIYDVPQNSDEWLRARMGLPTASEFKKLLGIRKDAKDKVTRRKYLYQLAGEIITGEPTERYSNGHMERGHEMEPEARAFYSFMHDAPLTRVGFIRNGQKGCSPDSLVGNDGMLEIKTALPDILIDALFSDDPPAEHKAQFQGALWVAEREWIDICVYWPKMPSVVRRAYRDEPYIAELSRAVAEFNEELATLVGRIRAMAA